MRRLVIVFAVLIGMSIPAIASYEISEQWFGALSVDERADLQGSLVLLAHYGGLVDAEFGPGTYGAIVAWQSSIGVPPNGVITPAQMTRLDQMAAEAMSEMGMDLVEDLDGRFAIILPMGLLPERTQAGLGSVYRNLAGNFVVETFWRPRSAGDLNALYRKAVAEGGSSVTYSAFRGDLYVATGFSMGKYFYELVRDAGDGAAGFRFTYGEEFQRIGGIASVFAASYSAPTEMLGSLEQPQTPTTVPAPAVSESAPSPQQTGKIKGKEAVPDAYPEEGVNLFGNFVTFDDVPGLLAMIGDIGPKTPLDMRRALHSMEGPVMLALASDGGNVASALMVAYEVQELGLSTYVMPETGCYSACSFIFFAGKERLAEGELGVHQVWGEGADASTAQTVVSDILEAFSEFGVRQEVTSAMLRTPPENMYVFSQRELSEWNINVP